MFRNLFLLLLFLVFTLDISCQDRINTNNVSFSWGVKKYFNTPVIFYESSLHLSRFYKEYLDFSFSVARSDVNLNLDEGKLLLGRNQIAINSLYTNVKLYFDNVVVPYISGYFVKEQELPLSFCFLIGIGLENYTPKLYELNFLTGGGLVAEFFFNKRLSVKFQNTLWYILENLGIKTIVESNSVINPNISHWCLSSIFGLSYSFGIERYQMFNIMKKNRRKVIKGGDKF